MDQYALHDRYTVLLSNLHCDLPHDSHISIYKDFLERGGDVNYQDDYYKISVLSIAVKNNDVTALSLMLKNGANVNLQSKKCPEENLLISALLSESFDTMKVLLEADADLNFKDIDGRDVFDRAKESTQGQKALKILNVEIKRRADVAKQTRKDKFEKAAQNVDKLSAPVRIRTFGGFKNQHDR